MHVHGIMTDASISIACNSGCQGLIAKKCNNSSNNCMLNMHIRDPCNR